MASTKLFPCIMNSILPANTQENVNKSGSGYKVYFEFSKYNEPTEFTDVKTGVKTVDDITAHAIVKKRSNGQVITGDTTSEAATETETSVTGINGVIVNIKIYKDDKGYYIVIKNKRIINKFEAGSIYQVQLRITDTMYVESTYGTVRSYLREEVNNFSEWSTASTFKIIGEPTFTCTHPTDTNILDLGGEFRSLRLSSSNELTAIDDNEYLVNYHFELYKGSKLIEISKEFYNNGNKYENQFEYNFKSLLSNGVTYRIKIIYTTNNGYSGVESIEHIPNYSDSTISLDELGLYNLENFSSDSNINKKFSRDEDEENGFIRLVLVKAENTSEKYTGSEIIIKRTDSRTNFSEWSIIKVYKCISGTEKIIKTFIDNTIESGIFYKYGMLLKDATNKYTQLKELSKESIRFFNHSYLNGENGKSLKLHLNNALNSFKPVLQEQKVEVINGFPFVLRNGGAKYKTFQLTGIISYWSGDEDDEHETFVNNKDLYGDNTKSIFNKYKNYEIQNGITLNNNFTRERFFREQVISYLQNNKSKLFRSASEGNLIVKILDLALTPNKTLNRLIYDFSCTAIEVQENAYDNYITNKFLVIEAEELKN